MEDDELMSWEFVNLETIDLRSEDAVSGSFAPTEMTRVPFAPAELMALFSRIGIPDESAQTLLSCLVQRG